MEPLVFSNFCFSWLFLQSSFKDLLPRAARTKYPPIYT